jgi:hypothetical protein
MPLINNLDKYFKKTFLSYDDIGIQFNTSSLNLLLDFKDATKLATFQKKMMNKTAKNFFLSEVQKLTVTVNNDNFYLIKKAIVDIINNMMNKKFYPNVLETE